MEIVNVKLVDINPADYNPRLISDNEKLKLRNSIETFGLVDPIIINLKNNKIIGGHQRYSVLLDIILENENLAEVEYPMLKHGDYGFIFDNKSPLLENDDYEKALNIALNKISGEWDYEKLGSLLDELKMSDLDFHLTGFDDLEIKELKLDDDEDEPDTSIPDNIDFFWETLEDGKGTIKYEPGESDHEIKDLYKLPDKNLDAIINEVENEELRDMLYLRKAWLVEFNYKQIADYYAYQATPKEQRAFEALALVLLDFDKLVENGYLQILDEYITDRDIEELM